MTNRQAGYSEGANQTPYMMRQFGYHGAILISGGGDTGVIDPSTTPLADWMLPELPENPNLVGLWDVGEDFDYQDGWTASGMPPATADVDDGATSFGPYLGAHRLRNDCSCANPHGSTKLGAPTRSGTIR